MTCIASLGRPSISCEVRLDEVTARPCVCRNFCSIPPIGSTRFATRGRPLHDPSVAPAYGIDAQGAEFCILPAKRSSGHNLNTPTSRAKMARTWKMFLLAADHSCSVTRPLFRIYTRARVRMQIYSSWPSDDAILQANWISLLPTWTVVDTDLALPLACLSFSSSR
jgi:hypothetical protein